RFAWGAGLSARFENMISDPVVTSLVRLVDAIQADPESVDALAGLLTHLGNVESDPAAFNATSASLVDLFQLLEDDASLVPLLHVAGRAVAPNAPEALASGEPLDLEHGSAGTVVELLADVQAYDDRNATLALLRNLIQNDPATGKSDLEVITDVLLEVNRATPGAGTPLTRDDHRMLLERSEAFLGDEAHGLERLMDVIQSRKRP
ncbi:MAG: hypothetical protein KC417_11210, partial [Myxococcales bacterium]|nr:hypothetical protein [Myxococcales bacterium]